MKFIYLLLLTLALNSHAKLHVEYNKENPQQIYSGIQPNDRTTKFFDPNVGLKAVNDYHGLALVLGMEYKCDGDTDFMKKSFGKFFNTKEAELEFTSGSPQRYDQWPETIIGGHFCTLYWISEAIGTNTNTTHSWGISISGFGVDVSYTINASQNVPLTKESKSETNTFYMHKDSDCW